MTRPNELLQQRATIIADAQALISKAGASADDLAKGRTMLAEADRLKEQADQLVVLERASLELAAQAATTATGKPGTEAAGPVGPNATPEYRAAFRDFMVNGPNGMSPANVRALSVGVGSQGGFTIAPEQFAHDLIQAVDNMVVIRGLATKLKLPVAVSLGIPTMETDVSDTDWTTELATGNEDTSLAFGKRKMVPTPLAKLIKISNDLLRASQGAGGAIDIEAFVRGRFAYKFGVTQEKAFMSGTGVSQPLGLFTASADGIATSRDFSAGNTSTSITFDGLIATKYAIKDQYRSKARWLFHRDGIAQVAGLKDGQGRYLWQPSVVIGVPDMILGNAVISSEYAPNTFTTGLYVGMFGDFSFYWIADSLDLQVQRLVELYAATNQIGLIGRLFTDGAPVLGEAFARIKLG